MRSLFLCAAIFGMTAPAYAGTRSINLSTTNANLSHWTVSELSKGGVVSAPGTFVHTYWGKAPGITIPFSDNDGFWYATNTFSLPASATNVSLTISQIGMDDRGVIELNGQPITASGASNSGSGFMQLTDPGSNVAYSFPYKAGAVNVTVTSGFVTGNNTLSVIVNNTYQGIYGSITPSGPTNFGVRAWVHYTISK